MRKAIINSNTGTSWVKRASILLLLTLAITIFVSDGWYKPKYAQAVSMTPTIEQAWTNIFNNTTVPGTIAYPVTATGPGRMLVVAVANIISTASTTNTISVSYGGQTMSKITNETTSSRTHTWLFYLNDAGIKAATNSNLVFTVGAATQRFYIVNAAVYKGVDQSASPISSSQSYLNNGTASATIGPFAANLVIGTGETAVEILSLSRYASTTPRTLATPAANWSSIFGPDTRAATDSANVYVLTDSTAGNTTSQHTASNTTNCSMTAMSMKPYVAPDIGTVTVSGNATYTTASPTISAAVTSTQTVTGCEYTTNGTAWSAGSLTGTAPNYTCTANPTGLSGTLTINIRATSIGIGTGVALSRTVDGAVPTDGASLYVGSGYLENALIWSAASDTGGSGIGSYDVRFSTTATPANCTSGTSAYTGRLTNYTHTGLTTGQPYYYRVCASDGAGNKSTGLTGNGTPVTRNSVVQSCGKCHVYLNTSNPVTDGTARNTPDGKFLGSHATHSGTSAGQYAYACSKCHATPAISNFAHTDRTISMANPINNDTNAKYGKGTSWGYTNSPSQFQNCSATYCHSNGTSVATGTIYTSISSPRWNTAITTCNKCHGTSTRTAGGPWYPNYNNYSTGTPLNTGWTSPGYALHEDGATATYTAATQQPLVLSSLKISQSALPAGKTITGISVAVKGKSATSRTLNVAMTKTGNATAVGTAKTVALTPTNEWHVVNTLVNDLWGTTWATTDILGAANTTFGVILKDNAATTSDINIDAIRVVVHTADAPKFNSHSAHIAKSYGCNKCHYATTTNGTSITDTSIHSVGSYSVVAGSGASFTFDNTAVGEPKCSNVSCHGPAVWGLNKFDCVSCHSVSITRTIGAAAGLTLSAVSTEFGLAWGHKKTGRGPVTAADCIVCHLEGNGTTKTASATYHQNGTIDLRDPAGTGETIIKDFANADFAFRRFSTNATRTSARNSADIAQVVSLKFCIICHKKEGATNPTARANGGTANSPWGASTGYALNANIGVTVANGTINVFSQFSSGNSSVHPVRAPRLKDFPISSRLNAPYQPTTLPGTRVAAGGTKANSIMLNCFDCHNVSGASPLRFRTVAAHGNAETIRGTVYANPSTLCSVCHAGYTVADQHGSGSAMAMSTGRTGEGFNGGCYSCHGDSGDTDAATLPTTTRPARAAGYHGFNTLLSGAATWPGLTAGGRPFAFIRNTATYSGTAAYHRPVSGPGLTTGSATCMGGAGCAGNGSAEPYTPGGQY